MNWPQAFLLMSLAFGVVAVFFADDSTVFWGAFVCLVVCGLTGIVLSLRRLG